MSAALCMITAETDGSVPSAPNGSRPPLSLMNEGRDSTLSHAATVLAATVNLPLKVTPPLLRWHGELRAEMECCELDSWYRLYREGTYCTCSAVEAFTLTYSCEWIIERVVLDFQASRNQSWTVRLGTKNTPEDVQVLREGNVVTMLWRSWLSWDSILFFLIPATVWLCFLSSRNWRTDWVPRNRHSFTRKC